MIKPRLKSTLAALRNCCTVIDYITISINKSSKIAVIKTISYPVIFGMLCGSNVSFEKYFSYITVPAMWNISTYTRHAS